MTAPRFDYETVYEDDGDDLGPVMGFNVSGHLDFADVELFVATETADWFGLEQDPLGFNVEHVWVRKIPTPYGYMRFRYQGHPGPGAKPVTNFSIETTWDKRCVNHPFEVATTGVHKSQVIDGDELADARGYVYLCRPCDVSFHDRLAAARAEALAALTREQEGASA